MPHTVAKSLRLSWFDGFLNCSSDTWQAIPNSYFNKYGGLPFLLKCNYDSKHFDKKMMFTIVNLFFGTIKELQQGANLFFANICFKNEFISYRIYYIKMCGKGNKCTTKLFKIFST